MISLLEQNNQKLPGVRFAPVLENVGQINREQSAQVGHPTLLQLPKHLRIKGFALLGGHRPGYQLPPHPR